MNRRWPNLEELYSLMKQFCLLALFLLFNSPVKAVDSPADAQYVIYLGDNGVLVLGFQIQVSGKSPMQSYLQYVDDLMKRMDANGDGIVTVEEARGKYLNAREAAQVQLIPQSDAAGPDTTPDVSPADGKISRSELLTYFKRIGLQPQVLQFLPSTGAAAMGGRQPRQAATPQDVPLFARLDLNNDGKLSANELTSALKTLRKLDLDDDETISSAELSPISNPFLAQQRQANAAGAASTSPFLGIGFDESLSKQIRRLIEKYDNTDPVKSGVTSSRIRNQKLSPMELGISTDAFARYDSDGDGQLDFDELRQFVTSPPMSIAIKVNIDAAEPVTAESKQSDLQEKLRTTPDGAANINLGTTQLSIVRSAGYNMGSAENFLKPQFMAADADANGYLDKSEAERAFLFGATFETLDLDKNGKVFLDEAVAYFQVRFDAARSRTVVAINEQGRTLFDILDTDRDRRLSYRELEAAANKLSLWDKDGDGMLSQSEIPQQYRIVVTRGNLPIFGGNPGDVDMAQAGAPAERTSGPLWFRKMDKNRDGEVSQREFLGDGAAFEKLDRNHDGFIDLGESLQAVDGS